MNSRKRSSFPCLILILILALVGCSEESPASPEYSPTSDSDTKTFISIHFEAGYKSRIFNDLPIEIPAEYLTHDFGWQEYLFDTAQNLVEKANEYGFHLTLMFNPQWAEYILQDNVRTEIVRNWQDQGHEIAYHHHSFSHVDWNGYSNDPASSSFPIYLGDVDAGLDFVRTLAEPQSVTSSMVDGLPGDMPFSFENSTEDLIFTGGSQYDSFEQYGDLRSLKPSQLIEADGSTVVLVAHRQLTWMSEDIPIEQALETFQEEYRNMENDEVYGIVFHCFDYLMASNSYDAWFEFIANQGDMVQSVSEVIADYDFTSPASALSVNLDPAVSHSAHPNPFNPQTTVEFSLPQSSTVNLSVFDVAGRLVKTLINGEFLSEGFHEISWNGRNNYGREVGSGTYVYRLQTPEFFGSESIVLIK